MWRKKLDVQHCRLCEVYSDLVERFIIKSKTKGGNAWRRSVGERGTTNSSHIKKVRRRGSGCERPRRISRRIYLFKKCKPTTVLFKLKIILRRKLKLELLSIKTKRRIWRNKCKKSRTRDYNQFSLKTLTLKRTETPLPCFSISGTLCSRKNNLPKRLEKIKIEKPESISKWILGEWDKISKLITAIWNITNIPI